MMKQLLKLSSAQTLPFFVETFCDTECSNVLRTAEHRGVLLNSSYWANMFEKKGLYRDLRLILVRTGDLIALSSHNAASVLTLLLSPNINPPFHLVLFQ